MTALFAATIAVGQFDIKKVLAYSTISQLGFMVAGVGMGAFAAGMFHLVTHAFFKALLFLSAGSIILGLERGHHHLGARPRTAHGSKEPEVFDPNDMRNMGGMRKTMPTTFWVYLVGALALGGIFPFAGFWSKDEILADAFREGYTLVYWLLTIAAFLTAFYMGRQIWMVFFGQPRHEAADKAEESPSVITIPLIVLAVLAVVGGALNLPGLDALTLWLEHTITAVHPGEFMPNVALDFHRAGTAGNPALMAAVRPQAAASRRGGSAQEAARARSSPACSASGIVDEAYKALILDRYVDLARFTANVIDDRFWHDWFHEKVLVGHLQLPDPHRAEPLRRPTRHRRLLQRPWAVDERRFRPVCGASRTASSAATHWWCWWVLWRCWDTCSSNEHCTGGRRDGTGQVFPLRGRHRAQRSMKEELQ